MDYFHSNVCAQPRPCPAHCALSSSVPLMEATRSAVAAPRPDLGTRPPLAAATSPPQQAVSMQETRSLSWSVEDR